MQMQIPETVRSKLRSLPDAPGCYLMRDRGGRIIYIGKAVSLRRRVQFYFREASFKRASPKLRGLVRSVYDIDIIEVKNEAAALLTEGELIKKYRPRYNAALKDDKRFLLIRVDLHAPVPRFDSVRLRRNDGALYFGPFVSSGAVRGTLDFVEKHFGIRKCSPQTPDAGTYKHCINDIVRFCSAPCIGRISLEDYRLRVDEACEFLYGRRPALMTQVRALMQEAAAALDYERAAALRDTLRMLDRVIRQEATVVQGPKMRKASAQAGLSYLKTLLNLSSLPEVIEAFDISNISGTLAVASMVCAVDGVPEPKRYRRFRIKTVSGSNDPAMIAEAVRRRIHGLQERGRPFPDLILLDGGITQLKAARAALRDLNVQIATAGLAKRYEELYYGDEGKPVRLPDHSEALLLLRRLRDEAHRFAISYHRQLRAARLRESVLDEIPGIGIQRKALLLNHFGSVRRLASASELEIAALPGMGVSMAAAIKRALQSYSSEPDA